MVRIWSLLIAVAVAGLMAVAAPGSLPAIVDLQISAPRDGSIVDGPNVVISGYANAGTVTVRVTGGNARVYSGQLTVKNGRWQTPSVRLGNGTFTATVDQGRTSKSVSFTVGSSRGFGFTSPENGASLTGSYVTFSGTADAGTITLRVYKGSSLVFRQDVGARNGKWSVSKQLDNGSYRAQAERSGTARTVTFTVGASKGFGFTSPENGASLSGPNVTFSGTADSGTVVLRVYQGSDIVFRQVVSSRNGRWSVTKRLDDGAYRAEADRNGNTRTISFRVGSGNPGNPGGSGNPSGLAFDIEYPRDGSTVNGPTVTFSGVATESTISIRLYDGDTIVYQGAVDVHDGRWSMSRRMSSGPHAVAVQQKGIIRTSKFTVRFGGSNTGTTSSNERVAFSSPRSGSTVSGPRVTISGTASTSSVGVYIYQGDNRVVQSSQKVVRGRWSFTTSLKSGSYRVEVTAGNGHATMSLRVK